MKETKEVADHARNCFPKIYQSSKWPMDDISCNSNHRYVYVCSINDAVSSTDAYHNIG
jgi:hypothetical protein